VFDFFQTQVILDRNTEGRIMSELVPKIEKIVENFFYENSAEHDWFHTLRVKTTAEALALEEYKVDIEIVSLASLLHDIADEKHYSDPKEGIRNVTAILRSEDTSPHIIGHIVEIFNTMFFKGAGVPTPMKSIEGKIVQDAERLDSLGAIGIARCFTEGARQGRDLYDPEYIPQRHVSKEAFTNSKADSLNHFHEKLYYLKDNMNTLAGKRLAAKRYKFMKKFEQQFKSEWNGTDMQPILQKIRAKSPWQDPYFLHFFALMSAALKDPIKFEKIKVDDFDLADPENIKEK